MARYILGSHHEALHFQLLTGLKLRQETEYFWPIYISITVFFTVIALFIIIIQNGIGRYKEWKLNQKITITLHEENVEDPKCYNTSKYDVSLLNGKEIAFIVTVFFGILLFFYFIEQWGRTLDDDDGMDLYKWQAFREFFLSLCKVFVPVAYLFAKRKRFFAKKNALAQYTGTKGCFK